MRKNGLIQIRIPAEDKKRIKEIAEKQEISISEILCNYINELIEKDDIREKYQENIQSRVIMTDEKLINLKKKMGW